MERRYVVSYNPIIQADKNLICAGREPDESDLYWIKQARAVVLPQGCRESLFKMAYMNCPNVFPDYRCRFWFPGKTGQIRMFRLFGLPHPKSLIFGGIRNCPEPVWNSLRYPVVVKSAAGGEGEGVFFVNGPEKVNEVKKILESYEKSGIYGFIIQEFIPNDGKDLRLVIMHNKVYGYWRKVVDGLSFYHNVSKGADIEHVDVERKLPSVYAIAKKLMKKVGINLAGIDLIFSLQDSYYERPYILEINYFFGRKGLGGNENYYKLLQNAVQEWLKDIN